MSVLLLLDDEQAAMIEDAAEMLTKMMEHRVRRADPDRIISNSIALQRRKMQQVLHQFEQGSIPNFAALTHADQARASELARLLCDCDKAVEANAIWAQLFALMVSSREKQGQGYAEKSRAVARAHLASTQKNERERT